MSQPSRLMFSCQEMSRLISDAMDRTLPLHVRIRMRLHLLICTLCQRYQKQLSLLRDVLRMNGAKLNEDDHANTPTLSLEAKARIRQKLDSHHP